MKKILVLVQDYPNNNGGVALMYVHVRNKYYIQHNIDVTVLNFSSVDDYVSLSVNISTLYGKHIFYILVMSEYCILDCWMELY